MAWYDNLMGGFNRAADTAQAPTGPTGEGGTATALGRVIQSFDDRRYRPESGGAAVGADVVAGRVTYHDGSPLARTPLVLELTDGSLRGTVTDDDGNYRFDDVSFPVELRLVDRLAFTSGNATEPTDRVSVPEFMPG